MNIPFSKNTTPWLMLVSRITLFAGVQALFALGFQFAGSSNAWETSANWWPFVVAIVNLICVALLVPLFQTEGSRYWDIFRFHREHVKGDILVLLGITIISAPITLLPNIWLGSWLFGDSNATLDLFVRPLPFWAVYALIFFFPVTQGIAELATYFGFVMPRLSSQGLPPFISISFCALMLGIQHIAVPLLFDVRFILWRGLMYIPFALLTGIALHWRPRMLPYFAIIHVLMNMSFATMFLSSAY